MKKISFMILLIIIFTGHVFGSDFPNIKGWKQVGEVRTYTPDNLWKYINGAAEQFLDYDFQSLQTSDQASDSLVVAVDIYDMGTSLNAFGIYSSERPQNQKKLDIGTQAVISPPYQALLLKDRYYVKVNVLEGELTETSGQDLLTAVAEALPGDKKFPEELQMLPEKGKIPGSEKYVLRGFLGMSDLKNCVFAEYKDNENDDVYKYFVVVSDNKKSFWQEMAEKWQTIDHHDFPVLIKEVPYQGLVGIMKTAKGIFGVTDVPNQKMLLNKLQTLVRH